MPAEVFQLEEIKRRCMDNTQLVHRVLASFRLSFISDLAQLEIHFLNGNTEGVATVAHKIKGSAANAAAPAIREIAKQIEMLAKEGSSDHDVLVGELQSEFTKFVTAVSREEALNAPDEEGNEEIPCVL